MRHHIVVLGLTLHVYRCSLVRATRPFFSHGSFWPRAKGTAEQPVSRGQGCHNQFLNPLYEARYKLNSMYLSRYNTANKTFFLSTFLCHHPTKRPNSNTSRAIYTANLKRLKFV